MVIPLGALLSMTELTLASRAGSTPRCGRAPRRSSEAKRRYEQASGEHQDHADDPAGPTGMHARRRERFRKRDRDDTRERRRAQREQDAPGAHPQDPVSRAKKTNGEQRGAK